MAIQFPLQIGIPLRSSSPFTGRVLRDCLSYATLAHQYQERINGLPYISHPVAVATRCAALFHDQTLTAAALLHDVIEDCEGYHLEEIELRYGTEVAFLVDAMTKTSLSLASDPSLQFEHYWEKLLWCGLEDIRVLLLKLADREHNIATLSVLPLRSQVKILCETIGLYIPLAQCLGTVHETRIPMLQRHWMHQLLTHGLLTPSSILEYLSSRGMELLSSCTQLGVLSNLQQVLQHVNHTCSDEDLMVLLPQLYDLCGDREFFVA